MVTIEQGHVGRIFYIRIHPNEDLVLSLEQSCIEAEITHALVRISVGSLAHCSLRCGAQSTLELSGPALEIMNLNGEIRPDAAGQPKAQLNGVVMDLQGRFHAGRFVRARNPACMTIEAVIEEWCIEERTTY